MKEVTEEGVALANGHFAVINFQGEKEDGSRPENMKGEEYLLELGSNTFIPGFEDGVVGMKAGEEKKIDLSFPADYHVEELKEAKVTFFEVKVLEIKEKVYPEFNDELAKEFGHDSVEDFLTKNREQLTQQKTRAADEKLHGEIRDLKKLIEKNQFDLPKTMVSQQEGYLKEDLKRNLTQQGFNDAMTEEYFANHYGRRCNSKS